MTDFRANVSGLRRPKILIRAARCGLADYRRDRDLKRVLHGQSPSPPQAVARLLEEETALETTRLCGHATYSIAHHVEVLIALMAEVRLLPRVVARS